MGKYDNYSNIRRIKKAEKLVQKLKNKKKLDLYKIELAEQMLEKEKLFKSCQIFGRDDFLASMYNPNSDIMFSDDNKVIMFYGNLIKYEDIKSYIIIENQVESSYTTISTSKKGTLGRTIVGGALAGGVGAVIGATSASSQSKSNTTYYNSADGFLLKIFIKNSDIYYKCEIPNQGIISNKIPKLWLELGTKLDRIVAENNNVKN